MSRPAHVDSYYAASANAAPEHPELAGEVTCDVCVIGAGITGSSAALALAERGYDVVLIEGARVGWGASGRSGGQVIFGYARDMSLIRRLVGAGHARRLWELSVQSMALLKERVARHGIDCDLRPGHLHAAIKRRQVQELRAWREELEIEYDYGGLELWEHAGLSERLGTRRYRAGLYDPNSAHLHPLNYTLGLAQAAVAAGARLFEASPALRLEADGPGPVRVHTPRGEVRCREVLLCANAYLTNVAGTLRARIMPVGTYIAATEPLGAERARALIRNGMAVADINFVLDYFRLSADHRLLFGGRVSYSTLPPPRLAATMRKRMLRVFPQLADAAIQYCWGGFVAITMNRMPHLGRFAQHGYFAQGYSGHGLALAGMAGQLMAEAVAGTAERFDVLARIPHRSFPGGPTLRTPALVLAMLYYRLRDLF